MSSSTALDEAAHGAFDTIQIFTHELPDPDGLLSLHTFYKFQELPIEIRLQIWRETFPGPRLFRLLFPLNSTAMNPRILPPSPPTAHAVNQESRVELFREYQHVPAVIPLKADTSDNGLSLFSPGKDVLSVSCWEFGHHEDVWDRHIPDNITLLFDAIRKVEICSVLSDSPYSIAYGWNYKYGELFTMFRHLEEIHIIRYDPERSQASGWPPNKTLRDHIYAELQLQTERDPSIKIPAITSWDIRLKFSWRPPVLCNSFGFRERLGPAFERHWFKNRVQYYELIPAVEYY